MNDNYYDDDYLPEPADPQIQRDYEAALGDFLVKFNKLENLVSDIVRRGFEELGQPDLYVAAHKIDMKLYVLRVISLAIPTLHMPNIDEIKALNGERNNLAHGHFQQDQYSGKYVIVTQKGEERQHSVVTIQRLAKRAEAATNDLTTCMAHFWFGVPS